MTSNIDPSQLDSWLRVPVDELEAHPQAKVKLSILAAPADVHDWVAEDMLAEVAANNAAGRPTRWILPCGPTGQYPVFCELVNQRKVSLQNLHIFHMDDFLDWQARPLPVDHPFSFEGQMQRVFYDRIDPELNVPREQRHFPSVYAIDAISEAIQRAGGIDTTYAGIGYRGHLAFNEAPRSPWYTVTAEEFKASKTRILHLNEDTLIAASQRAVGGSTHLVPPMAITLGMKDLLSAKRVRVFTETGNWKQAVVRILLFSNVTIEYPVTFLQEHPDALLVVDTASASYPHLQD